MSDIQVCNRIVCWDNEDDVLVQRACASDKDSGLYTGYIDGVHVYYIRSTSGKRVVLTWGEALEIADELGRNPSADVFNRK